MSYSVFLLFFYAISHVDYVASRYRAENIIASARQPPSHQQWARTRGQHSTPPPYSIGEHNAHQLQEERTLQQHTVLQLQQHSVARTVSAREAPTLEHLAFIWEKSHPFRYRAYRDTQRSPVCFTSRPHVFSAIAQQMLADLGIVWQSPPELHGNALQQELFREIAEIIEQLAQVPYVSNIHRIAHDLRYQSAAALQDAHYATEMGDCIGGAQLIDIGTTLLAHLRAFVSGAIKGCVDGSISAVAGTIDFGLHPVTSIKNLYHFIFDIAQRANAYLPMSAPLQLPRFISPTLVEYQSLEEHWSAYKKRLKDASHNWRLLAARIKHAWNTTPSTEITTAVTYRTTTLVVNVLVAHRCTAIMSSTLSHIKPLFSTKLAQIGAGLRSFMQEAQSHLSSPWHAVTTVTGAESNVSQQFASFFKATQIRQPRSNSIPTRTTSTVIELRKQEAIQTIREAGSQLKLPTATVEMVIRNLERPEIEGCIKTFGTAIRKFRDTPGASEVIYKTIENSIDPKTFSTAKGAFFELSSGLDLKKMQHMIMEFNKKALGTDFDIITNTHIVECKNRNWGKILKVEDSLVKLQSQLAKASQEAANTNKNVMLITKHPLPSSCTTFRKWLRINMIDLIEGRHE